MTRFQITGIGLINVFEHGNQTFDFTGGHLLLRGHNGAGKSKALELTLPFALDGDTSSERLDPFGGRSRPMKWNLLMDGRHDTRQGYASLELHRPDTVRRMGAPLALRPPFVLPLARPGPTVGAEVIDRIDDVVRW